MIPKIVLRELRKLPYVNFFDVLAVTSLLNINGRESALEYIRALQEKRGIKQFPLGKLLFTPGVLDKIGQAQALELVCRHARGDWSEMDPEDQATNRRAVRGGGRVFSAYTVGEGEDAIRVWVITEADRAATTVLLPEEY